MFRNLFLILLANIFFLPVHGQTYKRTIDWFKSSKEIEMKKDDSKKNHQADKGFIHFEQAIYPNPETMLPFYFELIGLKSGVYNDEQVVARVVNRVYEAMPDDFTIIDFTKVDEGFNPTFEVGVSRKKSFLQVTVPTVRRSAFGDKLERLISFDIVIQYSETSYKKTIQPNTVSQSVLSAGKWMKLKVVETGVYRLSYSDIEAMGLPNPENVSVWGHDGKQLPYMNNEPSLDDLVQVPLLMSKGNDGVFNQGDYVLVYLSGPVSWSYSPEKQMFMHVLHDYSEYAGYFITTSRSDTKRVETINNNGLTANRVSVSYDARMFFERNDTNLIKSGRQWFGESFDVYSSRSYQSGFSNPIANGVAKIAVNVAARSSMGSIFYVKANGASVGSIQLMPVTISNEHADFFSQREQFFSFPYTQGILDIELTYSKPTPAAKSWLDYLVVNARQKIQFNGAQLGFRDIESVGEGNITTFEVSDASSNMMIWDVTDIFDVKSLGHESQEGTTVFKCETNTLREFLAFDPAKAFPVTVLGEVPNQNIHGEQQPEMIVVAHPDFLEQAQGLADIHFNHSGLRSLVVTTEQVYNEFSSGMPDAGAIRNMVRMFYNRSTSDTDIPHFLMLVGDGSYDNRTQRSVNTNFIPTYQSESSVNKMYSFVSDDFYGLLDENEGEAEGLLDIGIGRIPCSLKEEADVVVRKVDQYLNSTQPGSWMNQLTFIGDDQDSNLHMRQANELALLVESTYPRYNIEKIFFDAFPQVSTTQGNRYPDVTKAINSRANQGALIMNYTGHANAMWLSEEKVLMVSDIISWRNFERLPLFVTATCEFSRFDDFGRKSAGEYVLFASKGGGVGLVSTTRIVFASSNHVLNMNFYRWVFKQREYSSNKNQVDKNFYSLGEVLRYTKINSGSGYNKRSFMLLGDPALMLHYPDYELRVTSINSIPVSEPLDTLKSLSKVSVQAMVEGTSKNQDLSGEAEIILFDKTKDITTLSNDGETPFEFSTRENVIYRGRSSIQNGVFEATFIVPKDISYSFGSGRFSLFATSNENIGSGFFEDFIVGGISSNSGGDITGPEIEIFMNDNKFVPGGITDPNPKLLAFFTDSSGLNTTGSGIGHDLVATLIGESESSFVLNDYYIANVDSYQKGQVEYQLTDLKPGKYSLKIKAWDVYNNSSESEIDFLVKTDNNFELTHVINYPNPFTESTAFYFEHNQPYEPFDVLIQVLSPSGKLVKTLEYFFPGDGSYRIGPIHWDGLDDFGDRIGRGVYFYRVKIRLTNGKTIERYEKLVNLR